MRIAYIAPYQGPTVVKRRPVVQNLSLASTTKIEQLASVLRSSSHSVEVFSQGEVVEHGLKFYPAFKESEAFHPDIPVHYGSAFPVRFLNGFTSSQSLLRLFKARHRASAFDAVLIYNLKAPQVTCANYAMRSLNMPVILEYEDDAFATFSKHGKSGLTSNYYLSQARQTLNTVAACIGASPHLLSQTPASMPKLLLRGTVGRSIVDPKAETKPQRMNRIIFSGTHSRTKGLEQLIKAWDMASLPGWELHITGRGEMTDRLRQMAATSRGIVFHGVVDSSAFANLLFSARIGINPEDVSRVPGSIFAFKTIEYLAAGLHVVTTPMGPVEPEIEEGFTYLQDNKPETIARILKNVIENRCYDRIAQKAAIQTYGPEAVSASLLRLLKEVAGEKVANGSI
jgi:glycosyltransferase involved in cell wall biosynthesis